MDDESGEFMERAKLLFVLRMSVCALAGLTAICHSMRSSTVKW